MTAAGWGWMAGSVIGSMLFAPDAPDGPRIADKGVRAGTIRPGIDPLLLYISIASLCYFYISNIHTLTVVFARNLKTEDSRQGHVEHVVALVRQGIAAAA